MAVTLNASTTAGLELTPDTSGVLNIQSGGSTKIAVTSAGVAVTGLSKASLPTGSVLQVVNYFPASSNGNTTSTTLTSTGLSATITPTSSTSKIYVFAIVGVEIDPGAKMGSTTIYRGSTNLAVSGTVMAAIRAQSGYIDAMIPMQVLDSPATTSATTYTIYVKTDTSSTLFWFNSSITLMEIAA